MKIRNLTLQLLNILLYIFLISNNSNSQNIDQNQIVYKDNNLHSQITKAEILIDELMQEKRIPGLSICVANGSKILLAEGFGYADLENKLPVRINTKFRIGSISKTLTALALGKLIEENEISLSDNLNKYIDYFPDKNYPITIGELASHTAGIRDYNYRNNEFMSAERYSSVKESIDIFKDDSLLFKPGTKYGYSTYGYVLLSAAIESAAGKDFLSYMLSDIFTPLGLENTVPDYNDSIIQFRSEFYDEIKGTVINGFHVDNSNKWAGGGFLSNSFDLAKIAQSLLNNQFLSKPSVEILWTPYKLSNGEEINYGIGWKIDADSLQRKYVYHGGSSMGGRSFLLVYPKEGIIIAVTCNLSTNFDQEFVLKLVETFLEN